MRTIRSLKNKKAISPVIATVILVAVAVAIAIAVAFWASGLAGTFTKFEKLEVSSAYSDAYDSGTGTWTVHLAVKNTGSSDATVTSILVNSIPIAEYSPVIEYNASAATLPISLPTGSAQEGIDLTVDSTAGFSNGQTIDIKLHTASGTDYPKSVVLP